MKDKDMFVSHPNDVYLLIKRITIEWENVEKLLEPDKKILNELIGEMYKTNMTKFNFTGKLEYKYIASLFFSNFFYQPLSKIMKSWFTFTNQVLEEQPMVSSLMTTPSGREKSLQIAY